MKLIYPPTVISYNWPEGDKRHLVESREVPYDCYLDAVLNMRIGDTVVHYAGAPGTGRVVYEITRIDKTGVYGIEIENTIRELTPDEI